MKAKTGAGTTARYGNAYSGQQRLFTLLIHNYERL